MSKVIGINSLVDLIRSKKKCKVVVPYEHGRLLGSSVNHIFQILQGLCIESKRKKENLLLAGDVDILFVCCNILNHQKLLGYEYIFTK